MADIILGIEQGDIIYYYDTSIGDVVQRDWSFQGGTPTGATSYGPAVTYNGVNSNGYSTTLTVTDAATVSGTVTKNNIIIVYPENISASVSASINGVLMDQSVYYQSSATAGSGITGYVWGIPGLGLTSGTYLSNVTYANLDWFNLAGTYGGSVNSSYIATATLSITSNVGNVFNSSANVTFNKMGPSEGFYYNEINGLTANGPYYTPSVTSYTSNDIGLGGSGLVVRIDQSSSLYAPINNTYSHSTDEVVYFYANSKDVMGTSKANPIRFRFISTQYALEVIGATYSAIPQLVSGSYILAGGINSTLDDYFYLTDYNTGGSDLTNLLLYKLRTNRFWSNNAIEKFLENKYYLSGSSKYIDSLGKVSVAIQSMRDVKYLGYNWLGGYGPYSPVYLGPALPASKYFFDNFGASIDVDVTIEVYDDRDTLIDFYTVVLSSSGDSYGSDGNSPDRNILTSQNTAHGSFLGFSRILTIATGSSSFNGNIGFESSSYYCPYEDYANSSDYEGIAIHILDPYHVASGRIIGRLNIIWGPSYTSGISSLGLSTPNYFEVPLTSSTGSSFLGITDKFNLPFPSTSYGEYKKGWSIGGEIA